MQFSPFPPFASFAPSAQGPGDAPREEGRAASAQPPSSPLPGQQPTASTAALHQEFSDLTRQIDRATLQPSTILPLTPPGSPQGSLPGRRSFEGLLHGSYSHVLPTPSPQEFSDLKRYNEAYARRAPWDPSRYHPPFPPQADGEPLSLRLLHFDPRDFNGAWTEQSPLFFPILRFPEADTQPCREHAPAPAPVPAPRRDATCRQGDQALDVEAGGGANKRRHREVAELFRQRELLLEAMIELESSRGGCSRRYKELTAAIDRITRSPAGIVSDPVPCSPPGGAQGGEAYLKRLRAAAQPIPSQQQLAALQAYNDDFAQRTPLEQMLYEPPFPPGRLQLGSLDARPSSAGPSPWAGRPVLSLYGGMVPLEAATLALQLRRHLAHQGPDEEVDPAYEEVAQACRRREEVRKLIEAGQNQDVAGVDESAAAEKSFVA